MEKIRYFDCNCVLGRRTIRNPGSFYETEELVRKMGYYGVENAMVYHSMARKYAPAVGNQLLMEEIKDNPSLQGVWVALPHHTCEFPEPSVLRREMKENNIKALRIFPEDCHFSLSEWSCGELFAMLEECRIPLMIDLNQIYWDGLHNILSAHPEMRVILTDVHYGIGRYIFPL